MVTEPVAVARELTLAGVPNILVMHCLVWVLLDGEVSLAGKEVPEQCALLPAGGRPVDVLGVEHGLFGQIGGLLHHGREWLKVWPVVPLVASCDSPVGDLASKDVAEKKARADGVVAEDET